MSKGEPSPWSRVPASTRRKIRDYVFARDRGQCQIKGEGCTGRAEELDHIVPIAADPSRILDLTNIRAACSICNGGRTSRRSAPPSREW